MNTSPLPGPNILLMGGSGTGKTYCIRTLLQCGITPCCIFTEPGFEVLGDIPKEKVHWHYIPPAGQSWEAMQKSAEFINKLSFEAVSKMSDANRGQYDQFVELLSSLNRFKCDRDDSDFGDVCTWGTDKAIILDGLSGIGAMAMGLVVGGKPVRHQGDWGIAMQLVENLVQKLCTDTRATFVLIAHTEREVDEVQGGSRIMASTLGRKLAPKLPRHFSDVILADRIGTKFTWSTAAAGAELKGRNVPIADNLEPSFVPLINKWKSQGGLIEGSSSSP